MFKQLISVSSAPGSKKRSTLILLDSMDKSGEVNHKRHHSAFKIWKTAKKQQLMSFFRVKHLLGDILSLHWWLLTSKRRSGGLYYPDQNSEPRDCRSFVHLKKKNASLSIISICWKCFESRRPKQAANGCNNGEFGRLWPWSQTGSSSTSWDGRKAFIYRSAVRRSNSIEGKTAAVGGGGGGCVCVCA